MLHANSEFFFQATGTYVPELVLGLKCDSVQGTLSDTAFFPYRTIKAVLPADSACSVDPNYPIWAGRKIVIDNNNLHKWQTITGDSVKIKSQTQIGDTQLIYLYPNNNKIIAIHSSNALLTFAAITDSVKYYTMQILNLSNNVVAGYWNGKKIIISKNNGVVQMPKILNFPVDTSMFFRVYAKRLKYIDVFPWQPGDELHEYHLTDDQFSFYTNSWLYNKTILTRTLINPDSVVFTMQVVTNHITDAPPSNTITNSTMIYSVGRLSSYIENKMPQQTIDSLHTYDLYYNPYDCGKLKMINHMINAFYLNNPSGCVQENNFEPHDYDNIYLEGVAGYYFYDYPYAGNGVTVDDFHNVYYSIGPSTCGTSYYVEIQELSKSDFLISPNPVTDFLSFNFFENYSGCPFEIFDLAGKQIQALTLEKNVPVDVRNLANGFYVGKIISADGNYQSIIRFVKNQ